MADTKWSLFPSATPGNSDEVVGLHSGDNARFSIANIVAAVRNGLANIFVPKTDVGAAGGVASLDNTGKVPSTQLPTIPSDAADISYDNTGSGLTAEDVQEAIDELAQGSGGGTTVVANPAGAATDTLTKLQVSNTIYSVSGGGSGANEAQLAYVESGTTASQNYTAGQYICWNGLLYTANQAISSGATLSAVTGGNLTECVGGGFNSMLPTSELIGTGHTLIRCGKLRILTISFYVGTAVITIPVADRPTTAAVGFGVYNDLSSAQMTLGTVTVNTDGSIAFHSWQSYNTSATASIVTNRWVNCPGVIWMTA